MAITWDAVFKTKPLGTDSPTEGDDQIRWTREAIQERMTHEHVNIDAPSATNGSAAADWWHREGSAKVYYVAAASAPTTRSDATTTLTDDDEGRVYVTSDDVPKEVFVYTGTIGGWVEVLGITSYVNMYDAQTIAGIKTFSSAPVFSSGTASQTVELTAGKAVTTVAITGTGNYVKSASPTLTGTIGAASMTLSGTLGVTGVATLTAQPILSSLTASLPVFTDASKGLVSNAMTGTGNVVMSASPTLTGTITAAAANFSGAVGVDGNFDVANTKFTVVAASGNTAVAGTLGVTGAATLSSTLAVTGDVAVNTNKFTVTAASGNTLIAGTLGVTGAITGTLATAAQTNITSLGTLTALQVDNLNLNGNTITGTTGAVNITPAAGSAIVLDGTISVDAGVVTGATSITSTAFVGTLSTAAQGNITSLGTLTILNVDNIRIDLNTISSTSGALNITPLAGQVILLDGTISIDAGVVTGATSITSTAFVGNLTGNASGTAATVTGAAQAAITSLGTLTTLTVDNINLNGSTITGMSDANTVITAYAGRAIAVEGVSFDGGAVTGVTTLATGAITTTSTIGRDADNNLSWGTDNQLDIEINAAVLSVTSFAKAATGAGDGTATYDVVLVTQAYVDKEIDTVVAGGVSPASEGAAGIAELATQAEVTTGTDDLRIITPLKFVTALASPPAIGGTAAAAGAFTSLTASGAATFNGNVTIGNATGDALTYHPSAWTLTNAVTITGTWTNLGTVTTVDINGGTIDGAAIGGASAAAGAFTTLTASGATTLDGNVTIGNATGDALTYHPSAWTLTNAVTITGTWANLGAVTTVDINGGTIDGTAIGGVSAAAGAFTTLTASGATTLNGNVTIGNASGDGLTYHPSAWTLTNAVTVTGTWANLGAVTTADINGGTVDGATIGGASAAAGTFTTLTGTTVVTDTVSEKTATAGVTIDGVLLKDSEITLNGVSKLVGFNFANTDSEDTVYDALAAYLSTSPTTHACLGRQGNNPVQYITYSAVGTGRYTLYAFGNVVETIDNGTGTAIGSAINLAVLVT